MRLIDTHCHLQFAQLGDTVKVLAEAQFQGVAGVVCPSTSIDDSQHAVMIAEKFDNVWAAVGVHPHDAAAFDNDPQQQTIIAELLSNPKVIAVGEIGLDYFKNYCPAEVQKATFKKLLQIGLKADKPFIFHVRDAFDDFFEIVDQLDGIRGVVHSFSAHPEELRGVIDRGLYVGLNGIMTFTEDEQQLNAAKLVPVDKLLIETDAPFLTPAPFRGTINSAKHVRVVAEFLGNLRDESTDNLASATTLNAETLFNIKVEN